MPHSSEDERMLICPGCPVPEKAEKDVICAECVLSHGEAFT